MSRFYFYKEKWKRPGKPEVYVETHRSTGRSYAPEWRRLQGTKRKSKR
jgi:hypothetical protein